MNNEEQTKRLEDDLRSLGSRLDRHLEVYAQNGKEIAKLSAEIKALNAVVVAYIQRSDDDTSKLAKDNKEAHHELMENLVTKDEFYFYKRLTWIIITAVIAQAGAVIFNVVSI